MNVVPSFHASCITSYESRQRVVSRDSDCPGSLRDRVSSTPSTHAFGLRARPLWKLKHLYNPTNELNNRARRPSRSRALEHKTGTQRDVWSVIYKSSIFLIALHAVGHWVTVGSIHRLKITFGRINSSCMSCNLRAFRGRITSLNSLRCVHPVQHSTSTATFSTQIVQLSALLSASLLAIILHSAHISYYTRLRVEIPARTLLQNYMF